MALLWLFCVVLWKAFVAQSVKGATLTASLHYGAFKGSYNAEYNISYWQKVHLLPHPLDKTFPVPQPPYHVRGLYNSTQTCPECPQANVSRIAFHSSEVLNTEQLRLV